MLMASDRPTVDQFAAATGWRIEPEGACKGEVCVPLSPDVVTDGIVNLDMVSERLGMGVARDVDNDLVAVGPASTGGRALSTTGAPDLELPDFDGQPFRLGSLRGTKVVLVAWAPY